MYELPPPPSVDGGGSAASGSAASRRRSGRRSRSQPYTWEGELAAERPARARSAATSPRWWASEELQDALATLRPAAAVEHLQQLFQIRGGTGSDGMLAIEIVELAATDRHPPARAGAPARGAGRPAGPEPGARWPTRSGASCIACGDAIDGLQAAAGRGDPDRASTCSSPSSRAGGPQYPTQHPAHGGCARRAAAAAAGCSGMAGVAALLAVGASVASLADRAADRSDPARLRRARRPSRTRTALARRGSRSGSTARDLVDRDPERAPSVLAEALAAIERAAASRRAGRGARRPCAPASSAASTALSRCAHRGGRDRWSTWPAASRASTRSDMVAASDGSLWVIEVRARPRDPRSIRPTDRRAVVVPRRPGARRGRPPGDPWLIATAATDVVRHRPRRGRPGASTSVEQTAASARPARGSIAIGARSSAAGRPPASAAARDLQPLPGRQRAATRC